jgi:transcription elongation GreA/GreB family factor
VKENTVYYFLREDFEGLCAKIEEIQTRIKIIGKDMGRSAQEGGETFHDNFAFEDGERQQFMWSSQLRTLLEIKNDARVVEPAKGDMVALGRAVHLEYLDTGQRRTIRIGSYMIFTKRVGEEIISYNAPLAHMLMGGKRGETREGVIGGKEREFLILEVSQ